jgi:acyl-CoA thioesterase FadM
MSSKKLPEPTPAERSFANCLQWRDRLFAVKRLVTLGKTNAYGGAYFAEFFEWTGEAREELLAQAGRLDGLTPHTSEARMKYFRELLPLEEFEIVVWPRVNRMSLSLRFFFLRGAELVAVGDQEICLKVAGRLVPIPQRVRELIAARDPALSQ